MIILCDVLVPHFRLCFFIFSAVVGAGGNTQHGTDKNTARLDRETEELHHDRVSMSVQRAIQQGRQAKGMTQKELATVRHRLTGHVILSMS